MGTTHQQLVNKYPSVHHARHHYSREMPFSRRECLGSLSCRSSQGWYNGFNAADAPARKRQWERRAGSQVKKKHHQSYRRLPGVLEEVRHASQVRTTKESFYSHPAAEPGIVYF